MELDELLANLYDFIEKTTTNESEKVYRGDGVFVNLRDEERLIQEGRMLLECAVKSDAYIEEENKELDERVRELDHIIKILKGDIAPKY